MSPVTVTAGGRIYTTVIDQQIERTAVLTGVVVDEATGGPPRDEVLVEVDREIAYGRVASGGMLGVSGNIEHLFPELATTAYTLNLTLRAPGYHTHTRLVNIPIASAFPINLGTIALRPLRARLEGRVTRESDRTPIGGARIVTLPTAPQLLLRMPLYLDHASGAAVTIRGLAPGAAQTLTANAPAGTLTFVLTALGAIGPGSVVLFGGREYGVVDFVTGLTTITLRHRLHRSYNIGATVAPVGVGVPGASTTLTRDADAGDGLLFLAAPIAGLGVEIGAGLEYHDTGAVSDAAGFFAADGAGGVRILTLRASAGGFLDQDLPVAIEHGAAVSTAAFRLRV